MLLLDQVPEAVAVERHHGGLGTRKIRRRDDESDQCRDKRNQGGVRQGSS